MKRLVLRRHFTLVRTFALFSLIILATIGSLLAWSLSTQMEQTALDQEASLAEAQAQILLHTGLLPQLGNGPLSPTALRHLTSYTAENLHYGGNVRVKIWSPNGTILFSDAPAAIGKRFALGDDELLVLSGRAESQADISDLTDPENATERGLAHHLLEVYVPIRLASGSIVGLYEIYHSLDALYANQALTRERIGIEVGAGFVVLYCGLFLLVGGASRRLTHLLDETRRREADATLLYRTSGRFRHHDRLQEVLQDVLSSLCATFGYRSCALLLLRQSDGRLHAEAGAGILREGNNADSGIALGEGLVGRAGAEKRIVFDSTPCEPDPARSGKQKVVARIAVPLLVGDHLLGVISVENAPSLSFGERDTKVLSVLADQAAMALQNARLFAQQEALYLAMLETMARTIDARDPYTAGHSQRVAAYSVAIGRQLGLDAADLQSLERGGLMHDIGKIGVADAVLRKPGALTAEERAEMERHPLIGHDLLRSLPFLSAELPLIRSHHERWDGRGYPDGLIAEQIPPGARIMAVADAFDAMTSDRPYRLGMSTDIARARLIEGSGSQFSPEAVGAFVTLLDSAEVTVEGQVASGTTRDAVVQSLRISPAYR